MNKCISRIVCLFLVPCLMGGSAVLVSLGPVNMSSSCPFRGRTPPFFTFQALANESAFVPERERDPASRIAKETARVAGHSVPHTIEDSAQLDSPADEVRRILFDAKADQSIGLMFGGKKYIGDLIPWLLRRGAVEWPTASHFGTVKAHIRVSEQYEAVIVQIVLNEAWAKSFPELLPLAEHDSQFPIPWSLVRIGVAVRRTTNGNVLIHLPDIELRSQFYGLSTGQRHWLGESRRMGVDLIAQWADAKGYLVVADHETFVREKRLNPKIMNDRTIATCYQGTYGHRPSWVPVRFDIVENFRGRQWYYVYHPLSGQGSDTPVNRPPSAEPAGMGTQTKATAHFKEVWMQLRKALTDKDEFEVGSLRNQLWHILINEVVHEEGIKYLQPLVMDVLNALNSNVAGSRAFENIFEEARARHREIFSADHREQIFDGRFHRPTRRQLRQVECLFDAMADAVSWGLKICLLNKLIFGREVIDWIVQNGNSVHKSHSNDHLFSGDGIVVGMAGLQAVVAGSPEARYGLSIRAAGAA